MFSLLLVPISAVCAVVLALLCLRGLVLLNYAARARDATRVRKLAWEEARLALMLAAAVVTVVTHGRALTAALILWIIALAARRPVGCRTPEQ